MRNSFLEYYGKHYISPVHQDISNMELHFERRRKLYRQCGIPVQTFRDTEILEVGPGSGYNTLAFFRWNCAHVDLVEANEKGICDMRELFKEHNIPSEKYQIFPCEIENYVSDKRYDIIIAEGFIQHLPNQQQILKKLQSLAADKGIVILTCSDQLCYFIEMMKRLVARFLVKDILDYEAQVSYLSGLFEQQLAGLKGVSRPARDWVQDMILGSSSNFTAQLLNLAQAISCFQKDYDILGTSPQMFTDYSWYKNIWFNYKEDYKQQYNRKKTSLLMADMPESVLPDKQVEMVSERFHYIIELAAEFEKNFESCYIKHILEQMNGIEKEVSVIDNGFMMVFCEIKMALKALIETGSVDFDQYPHFFQAFGRTEQYIGFEKK